MTWLIWKEFRLHWPILVVAALLTLAPYLLPLAAFWRKAWVAGDIADAFLISIVLSYFTMALLGGNAIASERTDRSSEFLACLPVSRWQIILSKLLLPVVVVLTIWVVNLAVLSTALYSAAIHNANRTDPVFITTCAFASFCAFSVAWLMSALQNSPTFAIGAGLLIPWATAMLIYWGGWLIGSPYFESDQNTPTLVGITFTLGAACFVGGTWYYLRRVEP